jgi:hypothetical protein
MSYKNAEQLKAKISESFDDFEEKFDPVLLFQALSDLATIAGNSPQFATELTDLLGEADNTLESFSITDLPEGATVMVKFNEAVLSFTLHYTEVTASIAPYIVKSAHSTQNEPRTWIRSGIQYHILQGGELNEEFQINIMHNLGIPMIALFVFTPSGEIVHSVTWEPNSVSPNTDLIITFTSGFEGERHAILIY